MPRSVVWEEKALIVHSVKQNILHVPQDNLPSSRLLQTHMLHMLLKPSKSAKMVNIAHREWVIMSQAKLQAVYNHRTITHLLYDFWWPQNISYEHETH